MAGGMKVFAYEKYKKKRSLAVQPVRALLANSNRATRAFNLNVTKHHSRSASAWEKNWLGVKTRGA
jgi:hypothetical protein